MKNILIYLGVIFVLGACSTSKSTKEAEGKTASVEQIAKNNFGDDFKITYNKSKRFAAITKKMDTEPYQLKIMVYDTKTAKILWGKKALKGKADWISRNELQVSYVTKQYKRNVQIYNAKTKQVSYK